MLLADAEIEIKHDKAVMIKEYEQQAKEEAENVLEISFLWLFKDVLLTM